MKNFTQILNEISGNEKIAKSIATAIYNEIFSNAIQCKDIDSFQCHCSVNQAKNNLKNNWWYKDLIFIVWNEKNWNKISDKIKNNKFKTNNKQINELLIDIADFSVNGHSIIRFKNYYIDPYLKSLKINDKLIQEFGKYWENLIK